MTETPANKSQHLRRPLASIVAAVECYVLMEILWTVLDPSGPRLYERAWQLIVRCRDKVRYRLQVTATLRSIKRLPDKQ